jgi:branched-chain amino acid transport system permease protein
MIALALLVAPFVAGSAYWISVLILAGIQVLLASSLRTLWLLHQSSLGHVGFALIGAYGSALLALRFGLPFWVTLPLAGVMAGGVALVLGYPFMRVKGIYFVMLTLLTAETFRLAMLNWQEVTGGIMGLLNIPAPDGLGLVDFGDPKNYYYLTLVVVVVSLWFLHRVEHSTLGVRWRAIRDAEHLAQVVGLNSTGYKIVNFAIACFFAGIAGALFAHHQGTLSPDIAAAFGVGASLHLVLYMFIGGQARFAGPIVGAIALVFLEELARPLQEARPVVLGLIAILVALFLQDGLVSLPERLRRLRGERGEIVPEEETYQMVEASIREEMS